MKIIDEETSLIPEYPIESIAPLGDVLFFDIETTGLKKETTQVYLIGCGYFKHENFCVRQWLTECALDEREVLEAFSDFASAYKVLIHFNGDGFDIPYLSAKMSAYDMDFSFADFISLDIYKKIKPLRQFLHQYHLNQTSVEAFLGIKRDDEMNGGTLISYYFDYEKTGSLENERLLLLHNHDDIIGMLKLISVLAYPDVFEGKFTFARAFLEGGYAVAEFLLDVPVKTTVDSEKNGVIISLQGGLLQINIPVAELSLKLPVANYKDYFYLPLEDTVIHKDVAGFVDKKYRCRATKDNAFLKVSVEAFLKQDADYYMKTAKTLLESAK